MMLAAAQFSLTGGGPPASAATDDDDLGRLGGPGCQSVPGSASEPETRTRLGELTVATADAGTAAAADRAKYRG